MEGMREGYDIGQPHPPLILYRGGRVIISICFIKEIKKGGRGYV